MLDKISKYRTELMGIAILWILWFHTEMIFKSSIVHLIKMLGYGGVDIFFFLSGFGLYKSLEHNTNILLFYKRRINKICPSYFPILFIWMILQILKKMPDNIEGFLVGNITGVSLWARTSPHFNWYIQSLLVFYMIAPLIKKIIDVYEKKGMYFCVGVTILISSVFWGDNILIAISRFPIFVIGMYFCKLMIEEKDFKLKQEVGLYCLLLVGIMTVSLCILKNPRLLGYYGMWWFPFILITPGLILFLIRVFDILKMGGGITIYRNFFIGNLFSPYCFI